MNVYVKIEILDREFEGRLLLAMAAAERGHDVLLGTMNALLSHRFWLQPGIYHDKSVSPKSSKIDLHRRLRDAGFIVTSQDEEHGLSEADYAPFVRRRFSDVTLSQAAHVFTWGPHDTRSLLAHHPGHAQRFTMTGSPRVDVWRPELAAIQRSDRLPGIDATRPFVLFSTSALPFQPNTFWRMIRDARPTQFPGSDDANEWRHYDKYAVAYAYAGRLVRAIRRTAAHLPDLQLVVRPHPTAVLEAWHDVLGDVPDNVHVVRDGGSGRWIANAAAVVHNGSTTGVEAAARGIPVISFQPNGERRDMFANRVGRIAEDEDGLTALIAEATGPQRPTSWGEDARAVLAERFAALDGPLAADRIVDVWDTFDTPTLHGINRPRRAHRLAGVHRRAGRLRSSARTALRGSTRTPGLDVSGKFPPLDHQRIDTTARAISTSLDRFHDVSVERIAPDLVRVRRTDGRP